LLYRTTWSAPYAATGITDNIGESVFAGTDSGWYGTPWSVRTGKYSVADAFATTSRKYTTNTVAPSEPK
jgi:hypothetical protein